MAKTITFNDNRPASTPKQGADLTQSAAIAAAGTLDTTEGVIPVTFFDFTKKGGRK